MVDYDELINYANLDGLSQYTGLILLTNIILRYPKPWDLDKEYIFLVSDDKTWNTNYVYG